MSIYFQTFLTVVPMIAKLLPESDCNDLNPSINDIWKFYLDATDCQIVVIDTIWYH